MNYSVTYIDKPNPGFHNWNLRFKLKSGATWHCDFQSLNSLMAFVEVLTLQSVK